MKKIVAVILTLLITLTVAGSWALYRIGKAAQSAETVTNNLSTTIARIDKHLDDEYLKNLRNYLYVQNDAIYASIDSLASVSREAADLLKDTRKRTGPALDKLPETIDKLNKILTRIDGETLQEASLTAAAVRDATNNISDKTGTLLASADLTLLGVNELVRSQRVINLLDSTNDAVANFSTATSTFNNSLLIVNTQLPSILQHSDSTLANISGLTFQTNIAFERFNRPRSAREKITSFFLESFIKASPVLIRR